MQMHFVLCLKKTGVDGSQNIVEDVSTWVKYVCIQSVCMITNDNKTIFALIRRRNGMSLLEDVWENEDRRREMNRENNLKYLHRLSDEEKLKLLWADYVSKHINDLRGDWK